MVIKTIFIEPKYKIQMTKGLWMINNIEDILEYFKDFNHGRKSRYFRYYNMRTWLDRQKEKYINSTFWKNTKDSPNKNMRTYDRSFLEKTWCESYMSTILKNAFDEDKNKYNKYFSIETLKEIEEERKRKSLLADCCSHAMYMPFPFHD